MSRSLCHSLTVCSEKEKMRKSLGPQVIFEDPIVHQSSGAHEEEEDVYENALVVDMHNIPDRETITSDKRTISIIQAYSPVAVIWGILLFIMALRMHFTAVLSARLHDQIKDLEKANQYFKSVTNNLTQQNQNWVRENNDLQVKVKEMEESQTALQAKITRMSQEIQGLRAENQHLNESNRRLMDENQVLNQSNKDLLEKILQAGDNTTSYPPFNRKKRQSEPCQTGWLHFQSSCYLFSLQDAPNQRTWEGARDDCIGKRADLVVRGSPEEQAFITDISEAMKGHSGFWIGLRVEEGSWEWVDGGHQTEGSSAVQRADSHHCGISAEEAKGWKAVSCDDKYSWICEMNAP